jgi:hypothetical protein
MSVFYPPTLTAALMAQQAPDSVELICVAVGESMAKLTQSFSRIYQIMSRKNWDIFSDILSEEQSAEAARKFAQFLSRDEAPNLPARISALMLAIDLCDADKMRAYYREQGRPDAMLYGKNIPMGVDCIIHDAQARLDVTRKAVQEAMTQSIRVAQSAGASVEGVRIPTKTMASGEQAGVAGATGPRQLA